jgi:hypothetical protein
MPSIRGSAWQPVQGAGYFLTTALVFLGAAASDPRAWWIAYVWGAAQVHFFRVRHPGMGRPFGRVGQAIIWVVAGIGVLNLLPDGSMPCPPCALTWRPLPDTVALLVTLLLPAVLLTWGLAPPPWHGWPTTRLGTATPPTSTEQAPCCWVVAAGLPLTALLLHDLNTAGLDRSIIRLVRGALGYSWVTLHFGAALALAPMGFCAFWGWTRALPWVLLGCWGVVTGFLLLSLAGWRPFWGG